MDVGGGMSERKLMGWQECGEKSRIETRLDFGGLPRSFFCDYLPPKQPFANRSLTTLIRSNPARQKMELSGKNRGSKTRAAVSPLSTGFTTFERFLHDNRDVRKRAPTFTNFSARARKVGRSYVKLKGSPKPWYPPPGVLVFPRKVGNLAAVGYEPRPSGLRSAPLTATPLGQSETRDYPPISPTRESHGFLTRTSIHRQCLERETGVWAGLRFFARIKTSEPLCGESKS